MRERVEGIGNKKKRMGMIFEDLREKKFTLGDNYQTPKEAVLYLFPYLKNEWVIWECAEGDGNISSVLRENGFKVIGTDITKGQDFLTYQPEAYDCIITNPPFSKKTAFLERAYSLNRSFAFLLPITALEGKKRQMLYKKYGIEILLPPKRIEYFNEGKGVWFYSAWFCWKLNIGSALKFI